MPPSRCSANTRGERTARSSTSLRPSSTDTASCQRPRTPPAEYGVGVPGDDDTPLALTVGCTVGLETPQPVSAVLQVAPSGSDLPVHAERWETDGPPLGTLELI